MEEGLILPSLFEGAFYYRGENMAVGNGPKGCSRNMRLRQKTKMAWEAGPGYKTTRPAAAIYLL